MADLETFTSPFKADEFAQTHVCSSCWGLLIKVRQEERRWVMQCEECGEQTKGYVTRRWAQQRAELSRAELSEAKRALRDAIPWLKPLKNIHKLLQELGVEP